MRKVMRLVVALVMVMAMSASAFAADITANSAKSIALKNAKLTAKKVTRMSVKLDHEDGVYEVKFRNKKNGNVYDYEIAAATGKIVEKSVDYKYKRNSSRKKVGKAAAQKAAARIAAVKLGVVQKGKCKYEYDDGEGIYEVEFRNGNYKFDIEILAPTGKVIDYNWEYKGR